MKYLLYSTTLFISLMFSCVMVILGRDYEGAEESPVYVRLCILLGIASMTVSLYSIFKNKKLTRKICVYAFGVPTIIALISLIESTFLDINTGLRDRFLGWFFAFSLPSIFIAIDTADLNSLRKMIKWLDIVMIIVSVGLIETIPILLDDWGSRMAGASHQIMSYVGAVAFGINFSMIKFGANFSFRLLDNMPFKSMRFVLLAIQVLCVLMSGGRGGTILMIINACVILFLTGAFKKSVRYLLAIALIAFVALGYLPILGISDALSTGIERAFSYVGDDGIELEGATSGRDVLYPMIWEYICERPIFGYGVFGAYTIIGGSAHNLFLEILMQGGVIASFIFIPYLIVLITRYVGMVKESAILRFFIPVFSFPLINLMFSSSYLWANFFWFAIVVIDLLRDNHVSRTLSTTMRTSAIPPSLRKYRRR